MKLDKTSECFVNVLEFVHLVIVCEVVGEWHGSLVRLRNVHLHAVRYSTVSVSIRIVVFNYDILMVYV